MRTPCLTCHCVLARLQPRQVLGHRQPKTVLGQPSVLGQSRLRFKAPAAMGLKVLRAGLRTQQRTSLTELRLTVAICRSPAPRVRA